MKDEERKKALWNKIKKLEAYHEIQNEMGRTTAAFNFGEKDKILSHFALDKPDVSIEYADEGVFEGKDAVEIIVEELTRGADVPGRMIDMQLTTPMIEVADDLETAKCVWWCPGAGTIPAGVDGTQEPQAIWAWGEISVDFIREDNVWKIWHLHYFRLIKCSYEKGWVEDLSMINRPNIPVNKMAKPSTYHNPYSPLSIRDGIPAMPLPYDRYTEKDRYWELSRDKEQEG